MYIKQKLGENYIFISQSIGWLALGFRGHKEQVPCTNTRLSWQPYHHEPSSDPMCHQPASEESECDLKQW